MGKPGETPICNFGYQYCLIMGGCVPKGGCPDDDAFMTSELTTCPHGQVSISLFHFFLILVMFVYAIGL